MDFSEISKGFFLEPFEVGSGSSDEFEEEDGERREGGAPNDTSSLFGDKWSLNISSLDLMDDKWGLIEKKPDSAPSSSGGSGDGTEDPEGRISSDGEDAGTPKNEDFDPENENVNLRSEDADAKNEDAGGEDEHISPGNEDIHSDGSTHEKSPERRTPDVPPTSVSNGESGGASDPDRMDLDLSSVKLEFDFNIDLSSIHLDLSELDADVVDSKSEAGNSSDQELHISDEVLKLSDAEDPPHISEDHRSVEDKGDQSSLEVEFSETGTICSDNKTATSEEEPDETDILTVGTDVEEVSLLGLNTSLPDVDINLRLTDYNLLVDETAKSDESDEMAIERHGETDASRDVSTDVAAFKAYTSGDDLEPVADDDDKSSQSDTEAEVVVLSTGQSDVLKPDVADVVIHRQSDVVETAKPSNGRYCEGVDDKKSANDKSDVIDRKSQMSDVSKIDLSFDWSFLEPAYDSSALFKDLALDKGFRGHLGSLEDNRTLDEQQNNDEPPTSPMARSIVENKQLITEMRTQNYDVIRFATYRTACKLRFLQKRTNLHLVDIWNMIEAFRENGLNSLDNNHLVTSSRLESLLTSIFYHLNKRLPNSSQIDAEQSVTMLHSWLMSAYDQDCQGKIRVFSIKVALATLCSGKLMDKLRYIFTQLVDSSGHMIWSRFEDYLREVLALPTAVFEKPSFGYNDTAARSCFDMNKKVTVNDFLDTLMTEPGPQCLMWQPILNRMATVENVRHPVQCEGCHRESFKGFRYKCERCYNYQLCQDCFWRGRTSGNHSNDHEVKEYSSYSSPAKELSQSLRKSFHCIPAKANQRIPHFPEEPEKTINLTHIVPPTPPPVHNGFNGSTLSCRSIGDASSMDSSSATKSPSKLLQGSIDSGRVDDEHRLIARYAARLAADANNASRSPTELNYNVDANKAQRDLVMQLEAKNREIMREIQRLRLEQEKQAKVSSEVAGQQRNPTLLAELRLLRQRRDELEARMTALQESRRELMVQLEGLMKLLKSHVSPRSTPNSSPRARTHSPPLVLATRSTPSTPGDTLAGLGSDVRQAFTQPNGGTNTSGSARSLRNDLLVAADSVTNAMSSLVKELNSEASSGSEDDDDDNNRRYHSGGDSMLDELAAFREEMQQKLQQESEFLKELQARKNMAPSHHRHGSHNEPDNYAGVTDGEMYSRPDDKAMVMSGDSESIMKSDNEGAELYDNNPRDLLPHRYTTDEESCLETDQESYIRTDDEEGGNTEWEDAMRRWVNR